MPTTLGLVTEPKALGVPAAGWKTGAKALCLYNQFPQACKPIRRAPPWLTSALVEWNALYCALSLHKIHRKEIIIIKDMWQGTLYSVDPGQGPKLACMYGNLEPPGPRAFRAWVSVSNRMEWAIELFSKHV